MTVDPDADFDPPTRKMRREDKAAAKAGQNKYRSTYEAGVAEGKESSTPTTSTPNSSSGPSLPSVEVGAAQRKILAAMTVTALFAIIGQAVNGGASTALPPGIQGPIEKPTTADPFKILLGAGAAALILIGVSELGEAGAEFGQGIALLAVLTSTLVYGRPVWDALSNKLGVKASPAVTTAPTAPTGTVRPSVSTAATRAT